MPFTSCNRIYWEKCLSEDENGTNEINDCGDIGSISVENREITRGNRRSEKQQNKS